MQYGNALPPSLLDALEEMIGTYLSANATVVILNATTVQIPAGTGNAQVGLTLNGRWRYNSANVQATHPGGAAGVYALWATGSANAFVAGGGEETDNTVYAFALEIRASGTPSAALSRQIGSVEWDGSAIVDAYLLNEQPADGPVGTPSMRTLGTGARQAAPGTVDAAVGVGSVRTLGSGALQAAPGNDARLSDQRVPTDGSVTNAKVSASAAIAKSKLASLAIVDADVSVGAAIAEAKLALASDAAPGTASRRTLGTGANQAAAGNDSRLGAATSAPPGTVTDGSYIWNGATWVNAKIVDANVAAGAGIAKSKLASLAIADADVAAGAAIAETKLNLAVDAVAGTASRRSLGTGAQQAASGADARFGDAAVPQGLRAARPTGVANHFYYATDVGRLFYCVAPSTWIDLCVPCGTIIAYPSLVPPDAFWLYCNGQAVSRTGATLDLFNKIGIAHGVGNGTTSFNIPDGRGRSLVGADDGALRVVTAPHIIGAVGGEERHLLLAAEAAQKAGNTDPGGAHNHTPSNGNAFMTNGGGVNANVSLGGGGYVLDVATNVVAAHPHSIPGSPATTTHENMQPFVTEAYMIRI